MYDTYMSRIGILLLVFLAMLLAACSSAEEQAPVEEEQAPAEEEAAVEETSTEETTEETTEPTEERAQATVTRLLSEDEKAAVLACQIEKAERDGYDVQAALQEAINSDKLLTDVLKEDGYICTVEEALEMARLEAEAAQAVPQPEQLPAPRPPNASEKADMCAQGISEACYSHEPQPRKSMSEKTPEERAPVVEQRVNENPAVCNPQSNLSPAERAKYC